MPDQIQKVRLFPIRPKRGEAAVPELQADVRAGINDLADRSEGEWEASFFGLNMTRRMQKGSDDMYAPVMEMVRSEKAPESIDWVAKGKVTGVKFQENCGSCWAFVAVSVLESHYAINGGNLKFMSEQQLLDCVYPGENGCEGGWPSDAWVVIQDSLSNELPTGDSYAYKAKTQQCKKDREVNALVAANIDYNEDAMPYYQYVTVRYQGIQNGPYYDQELAKAVAIGPVAVAMKAINDFKVYKGGVYTSKNCHLARLNHALAVVGYTKDTFKIRNSWGPSWGENGYGYMDRRVQNLCSLAQFGSYPLIKKTGKSENQDKTDPCSKITCLNLGVCAPNKDKTSAKCYCPVGYSGESCETKYCEDSVKRCPKAGSRKCQNHKYPLNRSRDKSDGTKVISVLALVGYTEFVTEDGEEIDIIEDAIITLSQKEEKQRFRNFKQTFELVDKINKDGSSFQAGINDLADRSEGEWEASFFGLNMTRRMQKGSDDMYAPVMEMVRSEKAPESIDWVAKGKVTGVKFQENCGSCWAFVAVSVLESHYAINGGNLKFMSEQQLLDCVYPGENGCEGGWPSDAWVVIQDSLSNELPTGDSYAYKAKTQQCKKDREVNALVAANIDYNEDAMPYYQYVTVRYQGIQNGPYYDQELAKAVAIGPVAVAMKAINDFKVYKGGVYTSKNCHLARLNHALAVVGYTKDTFKIRNSWGPSWGENGYGYMDRRVQNLCSLAQFGSYPLIKKTGKSENQDKTDPCSKITCLNLGVCAPNKDKTSAKCYCAVGYSGESCETKYCEDSVKRCPKAGSRKCKKNYYQKSNNQANDMNG
eukprot:sb/3462147/